MTLQSDDIENFIASMVPNGIEKQEARGQQEFVSVQTLPKECPVAELEELGFIFGEDADDIFVNVKFPSGWTKAATEHSMWSDLLDAKGRIRGNIFYKAAFYDRHSHMHLTSFLKYSQIYESHEDYVENFVQFFVSNADGEILFKTDPVQAKNHTDEYWAAQDKSSEEIQNWLNKNFPKWQDKKEYWD